jgi:HEXXH motif-containing protein
VHFLDRRTRLRLAESLCYIRQQADGLLELSAQEFERFLVQLENQRVSPLAFSFYSDAVLAIEDDDLEEASRLLNRMIQLPPPTAALLISDLGDPARDETAARYARFIDTDDSVKFEIFAPSAEASASCREQIRGAFALMDAGDPELAVEIRALLREIILGAGTKEPKAMTFDGASSFMLWGAIIINANRSDGELGMVQMLAHESAHNLLFGLSADESLVENSAEELFPSPLRLDPRPMDGIYHATFVTARMHRAVQRLLESGVIDKKLRARAEKELEENARLFASGIETVNRYAKLTPLGKALMHEASAYMSRR